MSKGLFMISGAGFLWTLKISISNLSKLQTYPLQEVNQTLNYGLDAQFLRLFHECNLYGYLIFDCEISTGNWSIKNWNVWMWSIQTTRAKENWDVMKALRSFPNSNFKEHAILKKAFSFWPVFLQRYLTWGLNVNMLSIRQLVINNVDKSLIYFILFLWNLFGVEKNIPKQSFVHE